MKKIILGLGIIGTLLFAESASSEYTNMKDIEILTSKIKIKDNSPWNINNLYNEKNKSFFIPYQLWTGAKWDGDKNKKCTHQVDNTFYVNGNSPTKITGTTKWESPKTGKVYDIWKREKLNNHNNILKRKKSKKLKEQYFTCHEKGIGRVFDNRRGGRYSDVGKCKFPAGYGWKIGERQECLKTAIEITQIDFDKENNLTGLEFKFWYQNRKSGNLVLDHKYRYQPNIGMTKADKQ